MASPPIRAPASRAGEASSGTSSMPPVALASAARQGQFTCGPTPTLETAIRRDRSFS